MVHVYNCHPFSSQQIVQVSWAFKACVSYLNIDHFCLSNSTTVPQVDQEPGLVCCGGGALFVVANGGCKVNMKALICYSNNQPISFLSMSGNNQLSVLIISVVMLE